MANIHNLDTESSAASAAAWRDYADQLEQHGRPHVPDEQLSALLGDVYGEYIDAKIAENAARTAAYQRVADQARGHAQKLDNTRQAFEQADSDSAQRLSNVLVW